MVFVAHTVPLQWLWIIPRIKKTEKALACFSTAGRSPEIYTVTCCSYVPLPPSSLSLFHPTPRLSAFIWSLYMDAWLGHECDVLRSRCFSNLLVSRVLFPYVLFFFLPAWSNIDILLRGRWRSYNTGVRLYGRWRYPNIVVITVNVGGNLKAGVAR